MEWLAVFIGGGIGSILRYAISKWIPVQAGSFPTATFLANVCACLLLGLAWSYVSKHTDLNPHLKLLVLVGVCGGFSTFSTFSIETLRLLEGGKPFLALTYVLISVIACLLILFFSQKLM